MKKLLDLNPEKIDLGIPPLSHIFVFQIKKIPSFETFKGQRVSPAGFTAVKGISIGP